MIRHVEKTLEHSNFTEIITQIYKCNHFLPNFKQKSQKKKKSFLITFKLYSNSNNNNCIYFHVYQCSLITIYSHIYIYMQIWPQCYPRLAYTSLTTDTWLQINLNLIGSITCNVNNGNNKWRKNEWNSSFQWRFQLFLWWCFGWRFFYWETMVTHMPYF